MPKVLIVEDNLIFFRMMEMTLDLKGVEVLGARTLEDAENLIPNNLDSDLILMDACLGGDEPNTMPLVRRIVDLGYKGMIVTCSGVDVFNKLLRDAGATHEASKFDVREETLRLLNL